MSFPAGHPDTWKILGGNVRLSPLWFCKNEKLHICFPQSRDKSVTYQCPCVYAIEGNCLALLIGSFKRSYVFLSLRMGSIVLFLHMNHCLFWLFSSGESVCVYTSVHVCFHISICACGGETSTSGVFLHHSRGSISPSSWSSHHFSLADLSKSPRDPPVFAYLGPGLQMHTSVFSMVWRACSSNLGLLHLYMGTVLVLRHFYSSWIIEF